MVKLLKIFLLMATIFESISAICNAEPNDEYVSMTTASAQAESYFSEPTLNTHHDKVKVGYLKGTSFVYEDIPNHKSGYGYEYMEYLSNYANCKFEYVEFETWDELVKKFQAGEVDIIPDMPGDYKKVANAKRTDHVVGRYPMELVTKEIKPQMKIGYAPFFHSTPTLVNIARVEGFTYTMIPFQKINDIKKAFDHGEIDGYIDALIDPRFATNVWAVFDRQSYRLLILENRKELYDRINFAMEQLLLYQPNIRDTLNMRYLRKNGFPLTLSGSEKKYLERKKKLKAAIFLEHRPFAYRNDNGELVGVVPELIRKMSGDLNIEIEIVEGKNFQDIKDRISKGEIDFAADAVCDFSWTGEFNAVPVSPYMTVEYVPVTRRDYVINLEKPLKVACVRKLYHTTHFVESHFPESQRVYVSSYEEAVQAVNEGRADMALVQRSAANTIIDSTGTYSLEIKPASLFSEPRSLGICADEDPHLWQILNKEIGHIDPDWIRDVINTNQQSEAEFSISSITHHHPVKTFFVALAILSAIGGFFVYRARMRHRHFELVEHMAYTDLRYDLPNVRWLEREVPTVMENLESGMKMFFVVFSLVSSAAATKTQGHRLVDKQFRKLAANLAEENPVVLTAAGIDTDHIICFCKAESLDNLVDWAKSIIEKNSYMDTAVDSAKIVLHTRAGITPYDKFTDVQQAVDRALIACHQNISDEVKVFDEKLQATLTMDHNIEGRMEQALIDGEFQAWYQPKYDIRTREIVGAEALVRWINPELGFMPPGDFIPLFERNGFVIQVDYFLLEQTCRLQRQRLDEGKEVVPISVNQSRLHMTEEGYLEKIKMIMDAYEIPAGLIELEVTETMFGDFDAKAGHDNAAYVIDELHKMGFLISVDDFGSGYSSFMMLGSLPMDVMKIDRSLLTGADKSERMRNILANVIQLGNALKMKVLCEGIETREEEELLLELGCYYGQGFLNSKPLPMKDFVEFFEKRNAEVRSLDR